MEELSLDNLTLDTSDEDIFDIVSLSDTENTDKNKETENSNSEDLETKTNPESVATEEENKQSDKIPEVEKKEVNSSSPSLNDTEKLYSSLAAEFKAKGVLSKIELDKEEIKSLDDINKILEKELEARLGERHLALEKAKNAGASVNDVEAKIESIEKLNSITEDFLSKEENEELRFNIIAQDLINKGLSKERAASLAQRSIDSGDDVEEAKIAIKELVKLEETKLEELISSKSKEEENAIKSIRDQVEKEDEIIPGIKFTTKQKEDLFNQITTSDESGDSAFIKAQKQDPVGSRVKLEALFFVTKGLTDFSVFSNPKETKITNKIEDLLRGTSFTESGRVNTEKADELSTFTLKELAGYSIGE